MGSYLSSPVTEKVSDDGSIDELDFGSSSMQGWRKGMEVQLPVARTINHQDNQRMEPVANSRQRKVLMVTCCQDSHVHVSMGRGKSLFCVFDGHGGAQASSRPPKRTSLLPTLAPTPPLVFCCCALNLAACEPWAGGQVAQYAERHIAEVLAADPLFQEGEHSLALLHAFRRWAPSLFFSRSISHEASPRGLVGSMSS
jgi:hypothetical protein